MWTTRRATLADVPALRALCQDSVGPDDYVLDFLEPFVRESVTFVALDEDRAVGMMVYDDIPDGAAWLHAARTHPDYRRKGVATSLNRACEDLARIRRRSCLRLWAAAANGASTAASSRYGFGERARFTRMRIPASRPSPDVSLDPLDPEKVWPAIEASSLLHRTASYIFHDFYFMPLNRTTAAFLARTDSLWSFGRNGVAVSEDFEDVWGKDLQVQLLFGDPGEILHAAPAIGRAHGADRVESFLPHDPAILGAARKAGFASMGWGQEAILFEKPLSR